MPTLTTSIRPAEESDAADFARLIGVAYAVSAESSRAFVDRLPRIYARLIGEPAIGCVALLPLGQWFGGRRVEMTGIQAVAIAPEMRGRRVARHLMQEVIRELADRRVALSCLYASTAPLYRDVGYEHAGTRHQTVLRTRELTRRRASGRVVGTAESEVVRLGPEDESAIRMLHREFGRRFNGTIEREDYQWRRIAAPAGTEGAAERFGVRNEAGDLDGYAILLPERENGERELSVLDFAFRTEAAGRRLLSLITDFATVMPKATLFGGPTHPLVGLLDQPCADIKLTDIWMLRIVDLPSAIAQRGFALPLRLAFRIALDDPLVPGSAGEWVIDIADGRGTVRRPTRVDDQPLLQVGPRGLATIYSGFLTPAEARLRGLIDGDDEAMALAATAFAGPAPWMSDRF